MQNTLHKDLPSDLMIESAVSFFAARGGTVQAKAPATLSRSAEKSSYNQKEKCTYKNRCHYAGNFVMMYDGAYLNLTAVCPDHALRHICRTILDVVPSINKILCKASKFCNVIGIFIWLAFLFFLR